MKNFSKVLSMFLSISMIILMIVGCSTKSSEPKETNSSKEQASEDNNSKATADKKKGGSITMMASQNWIKDIDRTLFKKFQDETGIEVKVLLTPDNGYETLLGTSLSGGSNAVDMFMFSAGSPMVSAGIPEVALDLSDEEWVSRLEPWAVAANTYKNTLYGFSTWGIDFEGVLYNKSYFDENKLEVPKTWDQFMELLDTIKGLGKIPLYESINGVWHTQSWIYAMTPVMFEEDPDFIGKLNQTADNKFASSEKLKLGLSQLYELLNAKEDGKPKYYTNDGQSEDWFGSYPSMVNRDTVMMFTYSAYVSELKQKESTDEWGMFPLPIAGNTKGISNGGGISKYINKNSKNIDLCKELLEFLSREDNLEEYYGARSDLVSASFMGVNSVKPTDATNEIIELSGGADVPVMMMRDILYWDPDMYKYLQGFAEGTTTVDEFITNIDNYRATLFEASEN
ncbi:hypothetical protein SH1V18_00830 [Vallitalea longa]|uniref:Uncharacterized protein n=1 Tax=Vallitalea longa TaxID=2936439 RepID=A0A9W6DDS3_9FIRM|nr:extracellular solute-binding protein [Vallitalea longa]GKX27603.1 hypothetical protein SH1V18_00830 [Vallitalea longa]